MRQTTSSYPGDLKVEGRTRLGPGQPQSCLRGDETKNSANACAISSGPGPVTMRVFRTDEESMIAWMVCRVLDLPVEKVNDYDNKSD